MLTAPGLCWLCRMPLTLSGWGICSVCTRSLQGRISGCPQCGLPATSPQLPCGRCLKKPPPWCALVAVDHYVPPLSGLIHSLKFSSQSSLARPLARLLLLALLQARRTRQLPGVDMIMNVPLYRRRHWRRGYNQSDLLCRPLAHWLGCRYPASALTRVQATATQHRLNARLRKRNLKNAFRLELPVNGLHIALVDDVVTTGSTVAELSRLLLQSGAASVQVWCLCRTL
ncbi:MULTISPECIES: DNA utilization protein GntX [Enterobacter]|uniref:DNA utilization protein GntX n=1 Tax=Enterobacter cancerogenus TaxID=69218 RepID=UPI000C775E7C|nr:DNA utilization protein GntX [Enterobacter cancerogenus]AUJ83399.1 DNA utilization protein GntX [Enterobacter cancerogenus]EKS7428711.1 DNA utilization protein GntX [Enterobacter cancerogenus]PNF09072.1 DNA utilization protein GntX [Enterobacter cancerogenus]QGG10606.1 DNA utilization protein GntX [Enterobacter cancerogenus]HBI6868573.1 DNA utilization protein GntX [Enterobacter cancerogenus]